MARCLRSLIKLNLKTVKSESTIEYAVVVTAGLWSRATIYKLLSEQERFDDRRVRCLSLKAKMESNALNGSRINMPCEANQLMFVGRGPHREAKMVSVQVLKGLNRG